MNEHAIGYAWVLVTPVLYAACYIFIKRQLSSGHDESAVNAGWDVLRAFAGITLLQCWMQVVKSMSEFIRQHRGILRGLNIGPAPFVVAIVIEGGIAFFIRAALIVTAIPVLGLAFPSSISSWFWFAACFGSLLVSAAAVGLLLAPWAVLYGDVRKALSSLSLPVVLISPIFYPAIEHAGSALYWLNVFNPLASPLAVIMNVLQGGDWSVYMIPMLIVTGVFATLLMWSLVLLRRQMPILLERMGS